MKLFTYTDMKNYMITGNKYFTDITARIVFRCNRPQITFGKGLVRTRNVRYLSTSLLNNPFVPSIPNGRFIYSSLQNNPLFAPIPHEYIRDKQKVLNVYFNINEVDQFLLFCTRIKSSID